MGEFLLLYQLKHRQIEKLLQWLTNHDSAFTSLAYFLYYLLRSISQYLIEALHIILIFLCIHILARINSHSVRAEHLLWYLQNFIKILKKGLRFWPILLLNILFIYLNYSRKSINHKLFQESATRNWISCQVNINNFKIRQVL